MIIAPIRPPSAPPASAAQPFTLSIIGRDNEKLVCACAVTMPVLRKGCHRVASTSMCLCVCPSEYTETHAHTHAALVQCNCIRTETESCEAPKDCRLEKASSLPCSLVRVVNGKLINDGAIAAAVG